MKRFDYFRKPKDDLERPTFLGAVLSLLTVAAIIYFSIKESAYQASMQVQKRVVIDSGAVDNKNLFVINIDITFVRAPCAALSFTLRDLSGKDYTTSSSELTFQRLDANGTTEIAKDYVDKQIGLGYRSEKQDFKMLLTGAKDHEQCRVYGDVTVNKIPGSLTFSHALKKDLLKRVRSINKETYDEINLSHKISHLFFSEVAREDTNCVVPDKQYDLVEVDALEGSEFVHGHVVSCNYYLKAVPISLSKAGKAATKADYQYSYHVDCTVCCFRHNVTGIEAGERG